MRAVEVMRKRGIRRIPIVVADTLVGLLAEGDLKRAQPSALSDSQEEFNRVMEETPVSRIMIHRPVTVAEERRSSTPRRRCTARSSARCPCCATGGWSGSSPTRTSSAAWSTCSSRAASASGCRLGRQALRRQVHAEQDHRRAQQPERAEALAQEHEGEDAAQQDVEKEVERDVRQALGADRPVPDPIADVDGERARQRRDRPGRWRGWPPSRSRAARAGRTPAAAACPGPSCAPSRCGPDSAQTAARRPVRRQRSSRR